MRHYRYCGLHLASALALPELPEIRDASMLPDLHIVFAAVPARLATAIHRTETYEIDRSEALWRLAGVARYRISDSGRRIEVEPAALADAASVRLFLLQPVFALAAVLRGDGLLSAAAVARDGQVTAFIGPAASGKSTAAAVLLRRGWRLVSDSLLRITRDATTGQMLAHPQAPWLWLWPDAIRHLDLGAAATASLRPTLALRRLTYPAAEQPLPVTRIAILREQRSDDPDLFESTVRQGRHAFEMLLQHNAGNTWIAPLADRRRLFQWSTRIAQQALVERLEVPWGWAQLDALSAQLDRWCQSNVA